MFHVEHYASRHLSTRIKKAQSNDTPTQDT